jgi:predicted aspartyl protease
MRNLIVYASLAIALLAPTAVNAAAQCGPQRLATVVDMKFDQGVPVVPVSVAGKPKEFIVDTGAYVSVLFPPVVAELGLTRRNIALRIIGADGRSSNAAVRVPEFAIGRLRAADVSFMVGTGKDRGESGGAAGYLGPEILQTYDVDFDFGAGKFNLIDPNHCEGQVVYWPARAVAVVPFRLDSNFHIVFPATIDGKRVDAMLDTGASHTILYLNQAQRLFDIDVNAPDVEKFGELQGQAYTANVYRRRFNTIGLEGLVINNPYVVLMPDLVGPQLPRGPATGSLLPDPKNRPPDMPDLILGITDLSKMHVYIAYKERKIYFTSESADVSISAR